MNTIVVTGNCTKQIELTYSPQGTAFAKGSIAVRRDFRNQNNEYETDFFNFTVIGKLAEIVANHVSKGDHFGITGKLQNRTWEKEDGTKQYFTEIIVSGFDFPQKRQNSQNQGQNQSSNTNTTQRQQNQNQGYSRVDDDPFAGGGQVDISSDDLPF